LKPFRDTARQWSYFPSATEGVYAWKAGVLASRYQLLSKLGEGNTGTVWRALDLELERRLAVKVVEPRYVDTAELATRFLREVKAAARLGGPRGPRVRLRHGRGNCV